MKFPHFLARIICKCFLIVDPKYYEKSLAARKGICKGCGECCKGCPNLTLDNLCRVYRQRKPNGDYVCCFDGPRDKFDLWRIGVKGKCGYYWEKG